MLLPSQTKTVKTMSIDFLKTNNRKIIESVGPRYTSEINIETEYTDYFEALLKTQKFKNDILKQKGKLTREHASALNSLKNTLNDLYRENHNQLKILYKKIEQVLTGINDDKDFNIDVFTNSLNEYRALIAEVAWQKIDPLIDKGQYGLPKTDEDKNLDNTKNIFAKLITIIGDINEYIEQEYMIPYNTGILWLHGSAGQGKTHLLCDIANCEMRKNRPVILLLGTNFQNGESLWRTICDNLQLKGRCPKQTFLKYIKSLYTQHNQKILLLIDAINEGDGIYQWEEEFVEFIDDIAKTKKYLSVCLSCRSEYTNHFDLEKTSQKLFTLEHQGLTDSLTAITQYFSYYKIKHHEIPLSDEFTNPLFLKIYCVTLKNKNYTEMRRGHRGMKTMIEKFFVHIDYEIIGKKLNYPASIKKSHKKPAWELAKLCAEYMAENVTNDVPYSEAKIFEQKIITDFKINAGLLDLMIAEGLLIKYKKFHTNEYIINFAYQKFSDFLLSRCFLNKYFKKNKQNKYQFDTVFLKKLFSQQPYFNNKGIIHALSCEVPERTKREGCKDFVDYVEEYLKKSDNDDNRFYYDNIYTCYLESLIWRNPECINRETTIKRLNSFDAEYTLDTLLSVVTIQQHRLNINFITCQLSDKNIIHRDAFWTQYINKNFALNGTTKRIVNWGFTDFEKHNFNDESIQLLALTLCWFFTASNRFLRDQSTKALVNLLCYKITFANQLLEKFINIDDFYILERILASIYGALIRTKNKINKKEWQILAKLVYDKIFAVKPPFNIVVQYYAKQILIFTKKQNINVNFVDWQKCQPPYGYAMPHRLPLIEKLKKRMDSKGDISITHSVLSDDFGIYVLDRNNLGNGLTDWKDSSKPTTAEKEKIFNKNLSKLSKILYKKYKILLNHNSNQLMRAFDSVDDNVKNAETEFTASLPQSKKNKFEKYIKPYLYKPNNYEKENHIKANFLKQYILWRILKLGYDAKVLENDSANYGDFHHDYRTSHKIERIGKKYQWLAYFEAIALLFDNYEYSPYYNYDNTEEFLHISQLRYVNHIDPTILAKNAKDCSKILAEQSFNFQTLEPLNNVAPEEWVTTGNNDIDYKKLIIVENKNNEKWLTLHASYNFIEPKAPEEDENKYSSKKARFSIIDAYCFHLSDIEKVKNFLRQGEYYKLEDHSEYSTSWGNFQEIGWHDYKSETYNWILQDTNDIPFDYQITSSTYLYEQSGYDCSTQETLHITMPTPDLMLQLNLSFDKIDGQYINNQGEVVAIGLQHDKRRGIIINKNILQQYLDDNNLGIFWRIHSEKYMTHSSFLNNKHFARYEYYKAMILANGKYIDFPAKKNIRN